MSPYFSNPNATNPRPCAVMANRQRRYWDLAILASLFLSVSCAFAKSKITEQQPVTITPRDYAIIVVGVRVLDAPLTESARWRLAEEQDRWLEDTRPRPLGIGGTDPFNTSGRFATVTNSIGAISLGLSIGKKELPRRGVIASTVSIEKDALGDAEYVKADKDGHGYAIWKILVKKDSADSVAYISALSSKYSRLYVWSEKSFDTYVCRFMLDQPGWYYLGDVIVLGYVVDSSRLEKDPYSIYSRPSYGRPGYDTSTYEYEKVTGWKVLTTPICDEKRFLGLTEAATISRDFTKNKKRSEREFQEYFNLCGSWQKVKTK